MSVGNIEFFVRDGHLHLILGELAPCEVCGKQTPWVELDYACHFCSGECAEAFEQGAASKTLACALVYDGYPVSPVFIGIGGDFQTVGRGISFCGHYITHSEEYCAGYPDYWVAWHRPADYWNLPAVREHKSRVWGKWMHEYGTVARDKPDMQWCDCIRCRKVDDDLQAQVDAAMDDTIFGFNGQAIIF